MTLLSILIDCNIIIQNTMLCGVDEAGKGSVLGPMVIGVVGCNSEEDLKKIGVRDSKTLSPQQRKSLYTKIISSFPYFTVILSPKDIDRKRESMTMNDIVAAAHAEAIRAIGADIGYVDACDVNEERYAVTVSHLVGDKCRIIAKHKADVLFPVVSAASIVAKVTRDTIIESLWNEWGDFGSGYPSDQKTIDFLSRYIQKHTMAPSIARTSWATTQNLIDSLGQTRLFDY